MPRLLAASCLLLVFQATAVGCRVEAVGESPPKDPAVRRAHLEHLLELAHRTRDAAERHQLFEEALLLAEELAANDPGHASRHNLCAARVGAERSEAISTCEALLRAGGHPDEAAARYLLGQAYATAERWSDAETVLLEALEGLQESELRDHIYYQLGFVYEKTKRIDEALAAYQRGRSPRPVERPGCSCKMIEKHRIEAERAKKLSEEDHP